MSKTLENPNAGLLPTPQIGDRVVWYDRADKSVTPIAADVVGIEAPGRVKLELHRRTPKSYRDFVDGCWHVSAPIHEKDNANTRDCGGWEWLRGIAPKDAYDMHRKQNEDKEFARLQEAEAQERRLARRKEELAAV